MIPKGIKKIITLAVSRKASDIHICAGAPILLRIGKDLIPATEGTLTPELSEQMSMGLLTEAQFDTYVQPDKMVGSSNSF